MRARVAWLGLVVVVVAVVALGAVVDAGPKQNRTVPNLVGKSADEAKAALHAAGFDNDLEVDSTSLSCDHAPKVKNRQILCQKPEAGSVVDKGSYVYAVTYYEPKHEGVIVRAQLDALLGLTVDQAKAKLDELGFAGKLVIARLPQFAEKCGLDKVCGHEPESAVEVHELLTLYVNPKVEIAAPPP